MMSRGVSGLPCPLSHGSGVMERIYGVGVLPETVSWRSRRHALTRLTWGPKENVGAQQSTLDGEWILVKLRPFCPCRGQRFYAALSNALPSSPG